MAQEAIEAEQAAEPTLAASISDDDVRRYAVAEDGSQRVDRWLWVARLFKTRSQAAKACLAGHVKQDGDSLKAAKSLRVGDRIEVVTPATKRVLVVRRLADKRGPAAIARALYDDHSPPPPPREEREFGMRERGSGRPAKRERRRLIRLRGR